MSYYTIKQRRIVDEDGEDWDVHQFAADDDVVDIPWLRGMRLPLPPSQPIRLRFHEDSPEEAIFVDYVSRPIPLISRALREVLERAGATNVEFFDAVIEGADRHEDFPQYVAMNIVGAVTVADPVRSTSTRAFGVMGADLFDTFVPRSDLEAGLEIFRMAEQVSTVLVSERVVSLCDELGVQTLEFVPLASPGDQHDQAKV